MWAEIVSAQKENVSSLNLKFSHFQRNLIGLSHESENDYVLIGLSMQETADSNFYSYTVPFIIPLLWHSPF